MVNNDKISVGPPYYARTFAPLAIPLLALVVFGPMLNWKRDELRKVLERVRVPAIVAGAALLAALAFGGLKGLATAGDWRWPHGCWRARCGSWRAAGGRAGPISPGRSARRRAPSWASWWRTPAWGC